MSALRRLALGFPLDWSHRRRHSFSGREMAGIGPYYVEWDPGKGVFGEEWDGAPRDAGGVLLTGPYYHPIRIAQFALHRHATWLRTGEKTARGDFMAQAAWLRDHQQKHGVPGLYRFGFAWDKYGAEPGWWSAMAQGEAISVLLRADDVAPGNGFADAALEAATPFRYEIERGGVVWRREGDVFFEEIANEHAPHVLNGCIFALWGIWELRERSGTSWLDPLIEECTGTLLRWLPQFDTGWWTLYSLLRSAAGRPQVATLKYHEFHIAQMRVLAQMFENRAFAEAAGRWSAYVDTPRCRTRLLTATMGSLPERVLKRDTVRGGAHT
jgi:hypothetical protein